jgi:hypothetical protein
MCHDFKYFGQHIEIFMAKIKIHLIGIGINRPDPDGHTLDANTDLDPAKISGSDPIRIHKTGNIR